MSNGEQQSRLEEAFERIEETILPCIAMMLDTLLDASEFGRGGRAPFPRRRVADAGGRTEELTQAVERSSPAHVEPGEYKTRNVG